MSRLKDYDDFGIGMAGQQPRTAQGYQETAAMMAKSLMQIMPEDREQEFARLVAFYRSGIDWAFPDISEEKRADAERRFAEIVTEEFNRLVDVWMREPGNA